MNNGFIGIGGLLALGALKKLQESQNKLHGGRNQSYSSSCNSCETSDMTIKNMINTIEDCSYNIPNIKEIKAELQNSKTPGFGSFNKNDAERFKSAMTAMKYYLPHDQYIRFENLFEAFQQNEDKKTEQVIVELISRLGEKYPNQIRILIDMGITSINPKVGANGEDLGWSYETAKEIAKTIKVVGYSIFITRYLQQISFFVDEGMIPEIDRMHNNIYSDVDSWKVDWVCAEKSKNIRQQESLIQIVDELEREFDLFIDMDRYLLETKTTGEVTDKLMKKNDALMKMSRLAWFIELAKACGYGKSQGRELFFTYPMEKMATIKESPGQSIFDYIDYKLMVPANGAENVTFESLKEKFPDTFKKFKSVFKGMIPSKALYNRGDDISREQINILRQLKDQMTRSNLETFFEFNNELSSPRIAYINPRTRRKCSLIHFSLTQAYIHSHSFPVFTKTEKMNTISFSIPAGQPGSGGSCTVAGMNVAVPGIGVGDINFICNSCYALAGKYQMVDHILSNAPRMNWITKTLEACDDTNLTVEVSGQPASIKHKDEGILGALLSLCIESYARYAGGTNRRDMEIGVAEQGSLVYYGKDGASNKITSVKLKATGKNSQSYFNLKIKSNQGKVAGYFRIHDSGDFSISTNASIKYGYILAWKAVAECFGNVKFWAPTRIWTSGYERVKPRYRTYKGQAIYDQKALIQQMEEDLYIMRRTEYPRISMAQQDLERRIKEEQFLLQQKEYKYSGKSSPTVKGLLAFKEWLDADPRGSAPRGKQKTFKNKIISVSKSIADSIATKTILGMSNSQFARQYIFGGNGAAFREWKTSLFPDDGNVYMSAPRDLVVLDWACKTPTNNFIIRPSGLTSVNPYTAPFFPIPIINDRLVVVPLGGKKLFNPSNISAGTGVNLVVSLNASREDFTDKFYEKIGLNESLEKNSVTRQEKSTIKDRVRTSMFNYARSIYGLQPNSKVPKKIYTELRDTDGNIAYQCPVNKETNEEGKAISSRDSCAGSNCRACWVLPNMSVTYGEH